MTARDLFAEIDPQLIQGTVKLTILGQPITKKNSQQIILVNGRPCIIPSKPYKEYMKLAKPQLQGHQAPFLGPICVRALYYMATAREPDLTNLMAATHDLLEGCGVIANDSQVKSVDGSRIIGKDALNPRVEIEITDFIG